MIETKMEQTSKGRVLVVDDERNIAFVIQAMLERAGYSVRVFSDSRIASDAIQDEDFDTIVTDLSMPGLTGMDLLNQARKSCPTVPVVMITAFGTIEAAVAALKAGAFDFITKPFDQTELLNVIQKAVNTRRAREQEPVLFSSESDATSSESGGGTAGASERPASSAWAGSSAAVQSVLKLVEKIAASPSTVLLMGESGTGKELVSFEIHRRSPRNQKPFVKINCAAIPSSLIEAELFGYERGAFTGATTSKPGRFELAHEGTLFLDEVAEMHPDMQVKLLRVLQEHEFNRIGSVQPTRVDVRIITATNKDLEEEVRAGRFREDLFYRLNVVPIRIPPLRERKEDLEPLISVFIPQFNLKLGRHVRGVTPEVIGVLKNYSWPGNIRQLENVIERAVLMSESEWIKIQDLPEDVVRGSLSRPMGADGSGAEGETFKDLVKRKTQDLERALIERALLDSGNNVTKTAEKLGLSRKGLQLKLKELNIKRELSGQEN